MDNIKTLLQKQWTVGTRDWLKSLLYAIIVPILAQVISVVESGSLEFDWKTLLQLGIAAGAAHILRKLTDKTKVVTVQHIEKDQIPKAELLVAQANAEGDVPPPIGDPTHPAGEDNPDEGDDPPTIGDPTHPKKRAGNPPPIGDPTHPNT